MISAAVGSEDLERQLEVVRALAPGEMEGAFGPDSLTWRIDREALTFLGAGRALLLQLAHPWVAAAVVQHSRTLADPIGLFHRTFAVVFTMVFGTLDQALSAARGLHVVMPVSTIAATLPLGSVGYENHVNERGERYVWLPPFVIDRLRFLRRVRGELQRRDPAARGSEISREGRQRRSCRSVPAT